jgi:hypothetical protein
MIGRLNPDAVIGLRHPNSRDEIVDTGAIPKRSNDLA